jgi:hypothetical protein
MVDLVEPYVDLHQFIAWFEYGLQLVGKARAKPGKRRYYLTKLLEAIPSICEKQVPQVSLPAYTTDPDACPPEETLEQIKFLQIMEDGDEAGGEMRQNLGGGLVTPNLPYIEGVQGRSPFNSFLRADVRKCGQDKLLCHEILFLTVLRENFPNCPTEVVYAGCSPSSGETISHLSALLTAVPWITSFIGYDPEPTPIPVRAGDGPQPDVKIHQTLFDLRIAKQWSRNAILISDVWYGTAPDDRRQALEDQSDWSQCFFAYSLKFAIDSADYSPEGEQQAAVVYYHAPGRKVLQPWIACTSAETRLVYMPNMVCTDTTDVADYLTTLAYWQQNLRNPKWDASWSPPNLPALKLLYDLGERPRTPRRKRNNALTKALATYRLPPPIPPPLESISPPTLSDSAVVLPPSATPPSPKEQPRPNGASTISRGQRKRKARFKKKKVPITKPPPST